MSTKSLAELAIERLVALGLHQAEERARWFDSIAPLEAPPTDTIRYECPPLVQQIRARKAKPVQSALIVANDLIEAGVIKVAQGNVYWLPQGLEPSMVIKDAGMMQVVAFAELTREIDASTADLVLKVFLAATAADAADEAKARRENS